MEVPSDEELAAKYIDGLRCWVRYKSQNMSDWHNVFFFTKLAADEFSKVVRAGGGKAYDAAIKETYDSTEFKQRRAGG